MPKQIAIVGGGYAGVQLARSLDGAVDVTLIEPNSHFVHAPAMIRALVDPTLLDDALMPYDKLLDRGRVVKGRAESVDETGVTLTGGERIAADFIVIATGSTNAAPFKAAADGIDGLRASQHAIHMQLKAADTIAIVGAGAVGTELAGEIAHFFPAKKVTLISSEASLFPGKPDRLGLKLASKLRAAGVELIMGVRAGNLASSTEPYSGSLELSDGQQISADLIFPAVGARAVSVLLEQLPGVDRTAGGRIKTDGWMRPSSLPNVFTAGDVSDAGDDMTIVAVSRQIPWLKKTLLALVAGQTVESLKPYKPWARGKAPFLVPLGPKLGASFLVLFTAGDALTRMMKGKDLFITRYRKLLRRT